MVPLISRSVTIYPHQGLCSLKQHLGTKHSHHCYQYLYLSVPPCVCFYTVFQSGPIYCTYGNLLQDMIQTYAFSHTFSCHFWCFFQLLIGCNFSTFLITWFDLLEFVCDSTYFVF